MNFFVCSSLYYHAYEPSTILCSLRCVQTAGQRIRAEVLTSDREIPISELTIGLDANRFTKLEIPSQGSLQVHHEATVDTTVHLIDLLDIREERENAFEAVALPYLFPSRYAPSDRMRAVAMDLFGGIEGTFAQAMAIEDWLFRNLYYQVGTSTEQSSCLDTFESRSGVCRDFAHLGIAFCRALTIPARYLTVYAFQLEPQDFHAVFEVYIDGIWYVIDGTRKAPLNGLIRIASGRDASEAAVATLFGNIEGQGMQVTTLIAAEEDRSFTPLFRDDLLRKGKALFLG